eukprot:CAMPEP_0178398782 /NCGR_PEP_ID=MMETSP0689_2-20121128/14947_1 /TAXON_ID=160604 /ORGANISM="Amphidinium massartii, Strain CS-259" /LENGTH=513 /DNA_ID=CAMNT_0020019549 /DNA_START=91 /DNA_END=1632 /DNA_ORIENTATION=-
MFKATTASTGVVATSISTHGAPAYGRRSKSWQPQNLADFGDGGAFPELSLVQYPLEMGKTPMSTQKVVALNMDERGRIQWDAILKQGGAQYRLQVWARPEDAREKWSEPAELQRPTLELDEINTARTRKALELVLNGAIQAGLPKSREEKAPEFVRYIPNLNAPGYTPNCKERVVRITEREKDPMDPPRFKHKKVPRGPPSPPPPMMHSPARKLTAKDQQAWKIPPCISNWKNPKSCTVPLDKRLAADGRNLQDTTINDKFAALCEDLYLAERKARQEIEMRRKMQKELRVRAAELREIQLRELAAEARQQRAQLSAKDVAEGESEEQAGARQQRMGVLNQRSREIERDQRLELAGKKGKKRGRGEDRDISERIALGQAAQPTAHEAKFDARLFNQSAGMDSGFHGGDDGKNIAYDRPLFADRSHSGIYKFDKQRTQQAEGRFGHLGSKSFAGAADSGVPPSVAPLEFERDETHESKRKDPRGRGRSRSPRHRENEVLDIDRDDFGLSNLLDD